MYALHCYNPQMKRSLAETEVTYAVTVGHKQMRFFELDNVRNSSPVNQHQVIFTGQVQMFLAG